MSKPIPTRTLNPLPFEHLEPHRFEDLVRQLAYDLRSWRSLEATGRGGSDDGLDIRGIELVPRDAADDPEDEDGTAAAPLERVWTFQVKREKTTSPARIRQVVKESLASFATPPHGFVLAIAADVSKKARDAFREEMVAAGVAEHLLWAKGELEDLLFQAKNDRLLFAYFGISLQARRRSAGTTLRARIARKKQLSKLIEEAEDEDGLLVLLRDPNDERYPYPPAPGEPPPGWVLCFAQSAKQPGELLLQRREYVGCVKPDGRWDAVMDPEYDLLADRVASELDQREAWRFEDASTASALHLLFWNEYIPASEKIRIAVYATLSFDDIILIDPDGDGYFPVPQIFVEFVGGRPRYQYGYGKFKHAPGWPGTKLPSEEPDDDKHTAIFPTPLPAADAPHLPAFDDTLAESGLPPLSAEFATALVGLETRKPGPLPDIFPAAAPQRMDPTAFNAWRDEVARPTLSAIAHRLREPGLPARVVLGASRFPGVDAVALRFTLSARSWGTPIEARFVPGSGGDACGVELSPRDLKVDRKKVPETGIALAELDATGIERIVVELLHAASRRSTFET